MSDGKPIFAIDTVLVDIDGTITAANPAAAATPGTHDPFLRLIMHKTGLAEGEARARAAEAAVGEMVGSRWPFGVEAQFGITGEELWHAVSTEFRRRLILHADAAAFLTGLRSRFPRLKIHAATTNPSLFILGKLAVGGLAGRDGSPYLDGCCGGEEVSRGGKCGGDFYRALMARAGTTPSRCLMVGDEPPADLGFARAAGIEHVVLVRRDQPDPWQHGDDGGIYVRGLDVALDFIQG